MTPEPPIPENDPGYLQWREALWEGAGREVKEGWSRQIDVAAAAAYDAGRESALKEAALTIEALEKVAEAARNFHSWITDRTFYPSYISPADDAIRAALDALEKGEK